MSGFEPEEVNERISFLTASAYEPKGENHLTQVRLHNGMVGRLDLADDYAAVITVEFTGSIGVSVSAKTPTKTIAQLLIDIGTDLLTRDDKREGGTA